MPSAWTMKCLSGVSTLMLKAWHVVIEHGIQKDIYNSKQLSSIGVYNLICL